MDLPEISNPAEALQESILHKALLEATKSYDEDLNMVSIHFNKTYHCVTCTFNIVPKLYHF